MSDRKRISLEIKLREILDEYFTYYLFLVYDQDNRRMPDLVSDLLVAIESGES